ncbi:MAG: glycosyltransferase [Mariprofundaceae bacterium]|nr:glycosyltransferase [Mariprofundaceae bacterium]
MRILHLITRMDRGGSAVNTLISATEQLKQGHHVVLATGLSEESEMSADEAHRVDEAMAVFQVLGGVVKKLSSLRRSVGVHDWRAYREIAGLLDMQFDLVHTHTSKAGVLGRLAVGKRARVVHTPHGHIFHGYFGMLKTWLFAAVERRMARRSDALIALTKAEMDDHLKLGIGTAGQWHVIPSGVDVEAVSQRVNGIRAAADHHRSWDAVSVGRLVPVKGMDRLVRAWAQLCRQKPDARLAVIGDGGERQLLESLAAELGVEKNIHFAGWCDPLPYLADARSFVLLSRNEGMGRAVIEAFAASLPCVVSNVCGLSELVDAEVGRVVDAESAVEVAHALLSDWSPEIGERARMRADSYSVEAMVDGLSQLYERLCHD